MADFVDELRQRVADQDVHTPGECLDPWPVLVNDRRTLLRRYDAAIARAEKAEAMLAILHEKVTRWVDEFEATLETGSVQTCPGCGDMCLRCASTGEPVGACDHGIGPDRTCLECQQATQPKDS